MTTSTGARSRNKRISTLVETDDDTQTKRRTFDFSVDQPIISLKHLVSGGIVIFGVAWFVAGQWVFHTQMVTLKSDLLQTVGSNQKESIALQNSSAKEINEDINSIREDVSGVNYKLQELRLKNPYLK